MLICKDFQISNFRIHRNTKIEKIPSFLALVGKNDIGKSSIMESMDIFLNDKILDEDDKRINCPDPTNIQYSFIDNGIGLSVSKYNADYALTNKYINTKNEFPIFYLFGAESNGGWDIDEDCTVSELIENTNENSTSFAFFNTKESTLKIEFDELFTIFECCKQLLDDKEFINTFTIKYFLEKKDIQILLVNKERLYDNSLGNSKNCLDVLFGIIDKYDVVDSVKEMLGLISIGDLTDPLNEFLSTGKSEYLANKSLDSFYDELDNYNSELLQKIRTTIISSYLKGDNSLNISDNDFIYYYPNVEVLLIEDTIDNLLSSKEQVFIWIDEYLNQKEQDNLFNQWENILYGFGSNDIKIKKRGSGFRRLCHLYSFVVNKLSKRNYQKQLFLAVEEPEISLHPEQQRTLVQLLNVLTNDKLNVIISTHSPYIVNELEEVNVCILKRKVDNNGKELDDITDNALEEKLLKKNLLSEINYLAFEEASYDYHVALFGLLMNLINDKLGHCHLENIDKNFLKNEPYKSLTTFHTYFRTDKFEKLIVCKATETDPLKKYRNEIHSLPYCVRNYIDHPHDINSSFGDMNTVKTSIEQMTKIIKELKKLPNLT